MKKHAFIFDMDGVLIDSQPVHYDADLETLAHFGVQLTRADVEPCAFPCVSGSFSGAGNAGRNDGIP